MRTASQTVGSWFPTGFYGHDRMRKREEFINEYRQLARPQPPQAFIRRSSLPATSHVFSIHDNRHTFQRDVSYFQGMGRKKHPERSDLFKPGITWPLNKDTHKTGHPMISSYRQDFKMEEPHVQMLVNHPLSSSNTTCTTVYRITHGADSPNRNFINAMNNESLMLTLQNRQQRGKLKRKEKDARDTVASCMSWYKPKLPPVISDSDFNHIDIQPVKEPATKFCNHIDIQPVNEPTTKACNHIETSDTIATPEGHNMKDVVEPSCAEQNV